MVQPAQDSNHFPGRIYVQSYKKIAAPEKRFENPEIVGKQPIKACNLEEFIDMTEALFNDFMSREVVLTDSYGSKMKVYPTVTDVIKERFDNFMTQTVNNEGKTYDGYGEKHTRLTYIIDNQLKEFANKFTTDAVKQVSDEIKQHVKDGLTTKLGAELMSVLKVNEMLALPSKK